MAQRRFDEESISKNLQSILNEIHEIDNPDEINELRRIFRKHVPLFRRAYVAALLLKRAHLAPSAPAGSVGKPVERNKKPRPVPAQPKAPVASSNSNVSSSAEPTVYANKDNFVTLFVGIGRTRRVYPRDLMTLLMETCALSKDNIGAIKILDNYSFVDITIDKAQGVIDKLNNLDYRGRSLSVNFAKKKE